MHASGFSNKWDGYNPALSVLKRVYPTECNEDPQKAYDLYLQLPFFQFAAAANTGQLKKGMTFGEHPETNDQPQPKTELTKPEVKEKTVAEPQVETPKPEHASKRPRKSDARRKEQKRIEELEDENTRALDEAFAESEKVRLAKEEEQKLQDSIGKALAYNFRSETSTVLLHNPHYILPSSKKANPLDLSRCIEQRELLVMRSIHHTIELINALPQESINVAKIQEVIHEGKMHLDPASGGMDLFFQLPPLPASFTLSLSKLLHIVRVPMCATLSLRQILHPQVFKSGYATPNFPHILYNQIAQNFFRSMSLRHCTMAVSSPDIFQHFGHYKEFQTLKTSLSHLEWYCAEVEFSAHRSLFCAPPEGFLSGVYGSSDPLFSDFLHHFILQINISDRIRLPMTPFPNKKGKEKYEPFARSLLQKLEAWRSKFTELGECLPIPPSIMSTDTPIPTTESLSGQPEGSTVTLGAKGTEVGAGTRMLRELLKIFFMCCLGAQTETTGSCAYSDLSQFTLLFLFHRKLSKVWNDRFLISQPLSFPSPAQRLLTLRAVWGTLFQLPEDFSQGRSWCTFRSCFHEAQQQGCD